MPPILSKDSANRAQKQQVYLNGFVEMPPIMDQDVRAVVLLNEQHYRYHGDNDNQAIQCGDVVLVHSGKF